MDINQSWWLQQFVISRIYSAFSGNYMPHMWSYAIENDFFCSCWFILNFRVDYIIAPLKVLQSLKESVTAPDEKYSFVRRLSPESAALYNFSELEVCLFVSIFYSQLLLKHQ